MTAAPFWRVFILAVKFVTLINTMIFSRLSDVKWGRIFLSHRTVVPDPDPCVLDGDLRFARVILGSVDQFALHHITQHRSATTFPIAGGKTADGTHFLDLSIMSTKFNKSSIFLFGRSHGVDFPPGSPCVLLLFAFSFIACIFVMPPSQRMAVIVTRFLDLIVRIVSDGRGSFLEEVIYSSLLNISPLIFMASDLDEALLKDSPKSLSTITIGCQLLYMPGYMFIGTRRIVLSLRPKITSTSVNDLGLTPSEAVRSCAFSFPLADDLVHGIATGEGGEAAIDLCGYTERWEARLQVVIQQGEKTSTSLFWEVDASLVAVISSGTRLMGRATDLRGETVSLHTIAFFRPLSPDGGEPVATTARVFSRSSL
ncbi:hypothetical protein AXF42_Ash005962 [Apostasia shenzhenica]|uniref:Uncharacterized protein n=1 Tax=Apostasia shenzhenica TaxID=1088818 RepID=A0A2I0AZW0_9ASPA|nr:hypothetical protein AXF42_Ash005962 [Apostasia shenzhenica]